jgi:arginyl-tRNA--protein-N-Asp/Glu arginylyltransferase
MVVEAQVEEYFSKSRSVKSVLNRAKLLVLRLKEMLYVTNQYLLSSQYRLET